MSCSIQEHAGKGKLLLARAMRLGPCLGKGAALVLYFGTAGDVLQVCHRELMQMLGGIWRTCTQLKLSLSHRWQGS